MTISKKEIENMIRERLGQIIILSHYLATSDVFYEGYVSKKIEKMPVLDKINQYRFNVMADYLKNEYGVQINYSLW